LVLAAPKPLMFKHFPKAGGKDVIKILSEAIGPANHLAGKEKVKNDSPKLDAFYVVPEFFPLRKFHPDDYFVIGSMRSPCDYYLSLWAYSSDALKQELLFHNVTGHRLLVNEVAHNLTHLYGLNPPYTNSADLDRFRMWLTYHSGIMTERAFESYGNPKGTDLDLNLVDCWVLTEKMEETIRHCLTLFERQDGVVHWSKFSVPEKDPVHPSQHKHCTAYFTEGMAHDIKTHDSIIFSRFHFDTCCASSPVPS